MISLQNHYFVQAENAPTVSLKFTLEPFEALQVYNHAPYM